MLLRTTITRVLLHRLIAHLCFLGTLFTTQGGTLEAQPLELPASGLWNTYNEQVNTVECTNLSDLYERLVMYVRNGQGELLGERHFDLPSYGTVHLVLNELAPANSYGIYRVERKTLSTQQPLLDCRTVFYRLAPAGASKPVEYAFAVPITAGYHETRHGIFNSYNVSGVSIPVQNYLTLFNPGTSPIALFVRVYAQDGVPADGQSIIVTDLQPGERRDYPLGFQHGEVVGTYEIIPSDTSVPYGAILARYSDSGAGSYNYAFALEPVVGSCAPNPVSVTTMDPATNYAEIANVSASDAYVDFEIYDQTGTLRHEDRVFVPAHGQHHIYINEHLGERQVGNLRVRCAPGTPNGVKLLLQSAVYGHTGPGTPQIAYAYAAQAPELTATEGARLAVPVNTYFNAANWLKLTDAKGEQLNINTHVYDFRGKPARSFMRTVVHHGSRDVGLHEGVQSSFTGLSLSHTSSPSGEFTADFIRVYPTVQGGIGYIMRTAPRILSIDPALQGTLRVAQGGHWFEYRNAPILLAGDSLTQGWMELGNDFNTTAYLDTLSQRGINAVMLWSYIGINDQSADPRIGYHAPRLWPWREMSLRVVPPYSFTFVDASGMPVFNDSYFDALSAFVKQANERDIVVLITVHDGWTKARFEGHPLNVQNGGPLNDRDEYIDLADYNNEMPDIWNPAWTRPQQTQFILEQFVERLIGATAPYPNVMYEIFNEGEWYDQTKLRAFQVHFLNFFKARTDRLLLINDDHVGGEDFREEPYADAISLHDPDWNAQSSANDAFEHYEERFFSENPFAKPIVFSEPVPEYQGEPELRDAIMRLMWGTLIGGGGFFIQNDTGWKIPNVPTDEVYNRLGYASTFFNLSGVEFSSMAPDGLFSSAGNCLVDVGREYVIYSQSGSSLTLDLSDVTGDFQVMFLDPRTGEYDDYAPVISGGAVETVINKPSDNDWVVWVVAQAG